jgi:outer membrane receptor for ferrienterochelin and colicins
MKKITFVLLGFIIFFTNILNAQQVLQKKSDKEYTISGIVVDKDANEEQIGVNIYVESDKMKGTISDFDGSFSLKANEGEVIVFKYVGYQDYKITVTKNEENLKVVLQTEALQLNNVVISASRRKEKILDAPASITTIDASSIQKKTGTDVGDHLKNISGVYMQKTGINSGTPSIRGFSGYFTSDVLSLSDYRVAKLPNTGLTQYQMLTGGDDDIDRIEVLRGPAAALYGPNANNGVIHMISKSPIDAPKIKFSSSIGFRQKIKGQIYMQGDKTPRYDEDNLFKRGIYTVGVFIADTIMNKNPNVKLGYKVSSKYFRALDWKYDDPGDPAEFIKFRASSDSVYYYRADGTIDPNGKGQKVANERDEQINNGSIDARFDIRIKDNINIVFNGGLTVSNGLITSPVGAFQNKGWRYYYAQTRFSWKDLFAQFYVNGNNSNNAIVVPVGGLYVDKSKMYALQLQHASTFFKRIFLVYGFDAFWTRPDTDGTINGKNEDKDNIDEYGLYFQGDYKIHPRFNVVFASRVDYNTVNKKVIFSPKLAISYKPGTGHNLRFTFSRAFKTPASAAYFVDSKQAEIPEGIEVRNVGTPRDGFQYSFANNPNFNDQLLPQFRSPYASNNNAYFNVGDGSINNQAWDGIKKALTSQFLVQFGFDPKSPLADVAGLLINTLAPATIPDSIGHQVKSLNTTTQRFEDNNNWTKTRNIPGLKPTITHSYELGYKGLLFKMLGVTLDVYRTDYKNYVAPVTMTTPTVQFNSSQLLSVIGPQVLQNYNNPANEILKIALDGILDKNPDLGGNNNGTGIDEMLALFQTALDNLPIGVITPMQANGPDMLLITRNIGDVTFYGLDLGVTAYLPKNFVLSTNYSWVSKDSIPIDDAIFNFIALNAPKHKFNVGLNYTIDKVGLSFGTRFQWNSGFPVNSGNFIGYQKSTHDMDLDISYTPKFWNDKFNVTVSIQNLYSNKQQRLIGSPVIGTTGIMKFSYTM